VRRGPPRAQDIDSIHTIAKSTGTSKDCGSMGGVEEEWFEQNAISTKPNQGSAAGLARKGRSVRPANGSAETGDKKNHRGGELRKTRIPRLNFA